MIVLIELEKFQDIEDDVEFCEKFLNEENCKSFPGKCFFNEGLFRIILCTGTLLIEEFCDRLKEFCDRHIKLEFSNIQ